MPELPEVETIKNALQKAVTGLKITQIDVKVAKMFSGDIKNILDQKITGAERRAKILQIKFASGYSLFIHFKLNGQLLLVSPKAVPEKHTHVILTLSNKKQLFFNDVRKFGWMKIDKQDFLTDLKLGVEPLSSDFTIKKFTELCHKEKKPIKEFLMNQNKIAGIGNIYAAESLFKAKINPSKPAGQLSAHEINVLHDCLIQTLQTAILFQGSSGKDETYLQLNGKKGNYQDHFLVYQREKAPCFRCHAPILRVKKGGRSTFFCPNCQKMK